MKIRKLLKKNQGEFMKGAYKKEMWQQILLKKWKIFKIKEKKNKRCVPSGKW